MNGVHDVDGMTCYGTVVREENEPLFHAPWEREAFALAVSLCEAGYYQWDEFRDHLIAEIAASERAVGPDASPERLLKNSCPSP